jgi:hypothetical protein
MPAQCTTPAHPLKRLSIAMANPPACDSRRLSIERATLTSGFSRCVARQRIVEPSS